MGSYLQNAQIQPVSPHVSSSRQSEPICKFHWIAAFNDELAFQNPADDFSYTEKPELQSTVSSYAKDNKETQDSFKKENPVEASISTAPGLEYVTQPASPIHYNEESLHFMEKPLAAHTALRSIPSPSLPQNFLYKESVSRNAEDPCYTGSSFDLHDMRVNCETEEIGVFSKEIQISEESLEASASHQKEVLGEDLESPGSASAWCPADVYRSAGASHETCVMPDVGESSESFQPLEEDLALNEAFQRLQHSNREQQVQIQELQCSNLHLQKKNKELQMKIIKQPVFFDIISKLEKNMEELIEDKYNMKLEKNEMNRKLQNLQESLAITEKHLQESRKEKETLQLQVKKFKADYILLQERYMTEVQQKNRSVSQCVQMDRSLVEKEGEVERLQQLKGELERATTSALDLLKREKETREQEFLSLQEEFQNHELENLKEKQKLKWRVEKLMAQVKNLLYLCENEKAKNIKLQQQINEVKNENAQLQEQVTKSQEQNCVSKVEIAQLQEKLEDRMEPDLAQDVTLPNAEHFKESQNVSDMLQKMQSLHFKKKDFDKELLKHKDRITTFRELIASEKAFQDHIVEISSFDSDEAKKVKDVPILLGAKLDEYHNLNEELDSVIKKLGSLVEVKEDHCHKLIEENDTYQRQLGCLISKVASYEEIIKCADQRLEGSHSQIVHLEERNKYLEDLIRRPMDRGRKLRPRSENHPKPMTSVGHPERHDKDCCVSG